MVKRIGIQIKERRKVLGILQNELTEMLRAEGIEIKDGVVGQWERCLRNTRINDRVALEKVLSFKINV